MTTLREAATRALEALEQIRTPLRINTALDAYDVSRAIAALRTALAESEQGGVCGRCGAWAVDPVLPYEQRTKPEQEPVAYIHRQGNHWEVSERFLCDDEKARGWTEEPLYTHPPQRKPLSDEEIVDIWADVSMDYDDQINIIEMARAIERAHGIGGEA